MPSNSLLIPRREHVRSTGWGVSPSKNDKRERARAGSADRVSSSTEFVSQILVLQLDIEEKSLSRSIELSGLNKDGGSLLIVREIGEYKCMSALPFALSGNTSSQALR